jgi:transcriptional regulator with XRE-family HTH domain
MIRLTDPGQLAPILADLRILNRLTQRQAAAASALRQGQISAFERGEVLPAPQSLFRLAGAYGYDLALIPREDA